MRSSRERNFKDLYRETIQSELRDPSVRKAKREFLKTFAEPSHPLGWGLAGLAAVVLVAAAALVLYFQVVAPKKEMAASYSKIGSRVVIEPARPKPAVEVLRLSSRVGSPIVFQKFHEDAPITVIWVLTGGGLK